MAQEEKYNVIIIGGGVTGTALLYVLSRYTNISRIAIFEKYNEAAMVNSHYDNNSQTLHFGDIETNYTLEKAKRVKEAADILVRYLKSYAPNAFTKGSKMVLAIGKKETRELEKRYEEFHTLFPKLKKIERDQISKLEPNVVKGRDYRENLLALVTEDGYAVNYKALSESFIRESRVTDKEIDIFFGTEVKEIKRKNEIYAVNTSKSSFSADVVAVMAGPHSLIFAHSLGYGKHFGILPVAGSFYCADNLLNGKVYTMQIKKLPFAAIHGDPDVNNRAETRFGPTAKVLPLFERHNYRTIADFIKTSIWNLSGVFSLIKIIADPTLFRYVFKNLAYDIPIIGKRFFLRSVRKIVPMAKYSSLHYGKGIGGIRPQIVNTKTMKLEMGEAEIVGDKILFNITPSPGASVSLKNAEQDALKIINFLGDLFSFDQQKWCLDTGSTMLECRE
ncbi:MAG: FAD-dependent oxidoreductase [Parcubacteria group bacterium]|nr:FAD-dependent oxidoreductase [Parcubacteria group bacterium]